MRSIKPGTVTLHAEVTNISSNGIWLLLGDRELFLAHKEFPWFENASIRDISNVEVHGEEHLYWPALDVDLSVDAIEHPDRYPLVIGTAPLQVGEAVKPTPAKRHRHSSDKLR